MFSYKNKNSKLDKIFEKKTEEFELESYSKM